MTQCAINLEEENLNSLLGSSDTPVLIDFWAPWCGPCRRMSPIVDELAQEYKGKVQVAKLNVEDFPDKANEYKIAGVPTFILFNKGDIQKKIIGLQTKPLLKRILDANI